MSKPLEPKATVAKKLTAAERQEGSDSWDKLVDDLRRALVGCRHTTINLTQERDALAAQLADRTKRLAALRDQVESGGCAAAHLGETSLECDATKPCGLCRLNSQLAKARGIAREAIDALRATDDARHGYGLLLLARFDALHWPDPTPEEQ